MTKSILITGGTGSFGRKFISSLISEENEWDKIIVFSRDELKQWEMQEKFPQERFKKLRYFLGDIRDYKRLRRAFEGVHTIIHAAALKQVPAAEYNPTEFINTNIHGSQNVIEAASDCGVKNIISLSTDKASSPINLYGATKLCSDKLFIAANRYSGHKLKCSVVRYGNVMGSRGSVIPVFLKQLNNGALKLTDPNMSRFNITLKQAINFVKYSMLKSLGGEIFIPKMPSYKLNTLAEAIDENINIEIIGRRPGEKDHEELFHSQDCYELLETSNTYVISNGIPREQYKSKWINNNSEEIFISKRVNAYSSDTNENFLSKDELKILIDEFKKERN
ncbi:MAG: UDP-N-acetylglucosamine 4,6-dehydratase (inverting) [Prochlorococcus marinus CUG1431]|uniref:UDP-N-acetylglucosamine 4,6-dehydratase (Inverting) n=1 Tax=Prochlorococcus marinus CUG1433 TaxID=2774506 RepID=A0A9D9BU15_PROMR|nr:UDP-N-acetylglucosamine 4,6-dehydratase (inverting) [Prochlorococcus marinus CUG1433]MBO6981197.1 UDP-N-acetylglucosamine 4,6-dehydratase (inverting) [Prochlorococcus marinus CUG1431]